MSPLTSFILEDPNYRELMNYAMRALAQRAHTTHELKEKLKKQSHYSSECGEAVLSRLQELGLLNDAAYLQRSLEEATQYRLQGSLKVASRLYKKGIPFAETQAAWRKLGISEKDLAEEALKRAAKRFKNLPKNKLYQRRAQFLASRGFSPETIYSLSARALKE